MEPTAAASPMANNGPPDACWRDACDAAHGMHGSAGCRAVMRGVFGKRQTLVLLGHSPAQRAVQAPGGHTPFGPSVVEADGVPVGLHLRAPLQANLSGLLELRAQEEGRGS